jgi:hypothetical protein
VAGQRLPAPSQHLGLSPCSGSAQQQPNGRSTRGACSSYLSTPASFDGGGTGDDPQAQGRRARKRCAADAAVAAAAADADDAPDSGSDAPPAKKGRGQSHGQPLAKTKSSFRGVYPADSSGHWVAAGELLLFRYALPQHPPCRP